MTVPLSGRIRPNSEAAPWVLEEIKTLEAEVERLRTERDKAQDLLNVAHAFHNLAVKERDYERLQVDRLRAALKVAAEGVCFAQGACGCAVCVARKAL